MLINFVDATNDANHYTKPPPPVEDGESDVTEIMLNATSFKKVCSGAR